MGCHELKKRGQLLWSIGPGLRDLDATSATCIEDTDDTNLYRCLLFAGKSRNLCHHRRTFEAVHVPQNRNAQRLPFAARLRVDDTARTAFQQFVAGNDKARRRLVTA
jgi:hypothetical protein